MKYLIRIGATVLFCAQILAVNAAEKAAPNYHAELAAMLIASDEDTLMKLLEPQVEVVISSIAAVNPGEEEKIRAIVLPEFESAVIMIKRRAADSIEEEYRAVLTDEETQEAVKFFRSPMGEKIGAAHKKIVVKRSSELKKTIKDYWELLALRIWNKIGESGLNHPVG